MKTNIAEFPMLGASRFPEVASDLVLFKESRWVSLSDLERVKLAGRAQVPVRDKDGKRLSAVWDEKKTKAAADRFAREYGWPFTVHISNLEGVAL